MTEEASPVPPDVPVPDVEEWSPKTRDDWVNMFSDAFKKANAPDPTPDPTPDDKPPRRTVGERLLGVRD